MRKIQDRIHWLLSVIISAIFVPIDLIFWIATIFLAIIRVAIHGIVVRIGKKVDTDWIYVARNEQISMLKFSEWLVTLYNKIAGL